MVTAGALYSAPERERACGSYGVDVVDIFIASFRDLITCQMTVKCYYFLIFSLTTSDMWRPFPTLLTVP